MKMHLFLLVYSLAGTAVAQVEMIEPRSRKAGGEVPNIPEFIYLRCGATSKDLDSKSRLVPGQRPDVYLLRISIKEAQFIKGSDSCIFTASSKENQLSADAVSFTIQGGSMRAPGSASPVFGSSKEFEVKYSRTRSYTAMLALTNPPIFMIVPEDGHVDGKDGDVSLVF